MLQKNTPNQLNNLWTHKIYVSNYHGIITFLSGCFKDIGIYGGFLKWWYPTTIGFPTKNDHFGVFWGYHHFRKHPYRDLDDFDGFGSIETIEASRRHHRSPPRRRPRRGRRRRGRHWVLRRHRAWRSGWSHGSYRIGRVTMISMTSKSLGKLGKYWELITFEYLGIVGKREMGWKMMDMMKLSLKL